MARSKYALTIENMAAIGALDEAFDLYQELCHIEDNALCKAREERPDALIWPDKFDRLCKYELNKYFCTHAHLFTSKHEKLYVNSTIIKVFSLWKFKKKRNEPLKLIYSQLGFSEFLIELEWLAARAIWYRTYGAKAGVDYERAFADINEHILELVQREKARTVFSPSTPEIAASMIEDAATVWVYGNTEMMGCVKNAHEVESRSLCVPLLDERTFLNLPVRYCRTCKKYFVSDQTLAAFESKYGRMLIRKKRESHGSVAFSGFAAESELHSWGYNVVQGELSELERHRLIEMLIKYKIMSNEAICRDIENALRIFTGNRNMALAVEKWQNDLVFTRRLTLSHPRGTGKLKQNSS